MGDTGIRRSRVEIALDAFTPVDESVYESLDAAARRRHADDLAKRLSVAAELSRVGASRLVDEVLTASNRPDVVADLDSLVEFGRLPEELTPLQHEQVGRAQIRDEILHFDRIMDLDALAGGRDLKPRRVQVWDTGPLAAAERLLTLTYERRVLRGDEPPEWLHVGAVQPGRLRNVGRAGAVLVRDGAPQLVAAAVGTNSDACLRRLERYCGKHPLGVAIGLLDYEMFLNGEPECALVAGAASDWFGERTVKVWACGDALVFTAFRDGHLQRISAVHRLAGGRLGDRATEYGRTEVSLDRADRLVLVSGDHAVTAADLSETLNQPNRRGRIHLNDNLATAFPSGLTAVFKPGPAARQEDGGLLVVRDYLRSRAAAHSGPVTVSMEVGHVHADRELGPIQERGIDIGGLVLRETAALNETRTAEQRIRFEIVPMVDDDHVVNRLSYSRYQRILAAKGVPAAEVVLESSPVMLDIACDLLKTALRQGGEGYALRRRGNNLYLESDPLRLELVEDVDGDMHIGCIVYDTALTLYRTARDTMQSLFQARTGHRGNIHHQMLAHYDTVTDPQARAGYRQQLDRLWKRPFATLAAERDTPYLEAYNRLQRQRREAGEQFVVLNILEDYYEPLELKVKKLAELLGVEIVLDCLFFSPYGAGLRGLYG